MSYLLEFTVDGLPRTTNQLTRMHWRMKHKHSVEWKRTVWAKCWHLKPPAPLGKAKLTLTRLSSQECDFDGLVSSFKHVIDGLVDSGVLTGDTMSIIGQPTYLWEKCAPRKGHIKVKVEGL